MLTLPKPSTAAVAALRCDTNSIRSAQAVARRLAVLAQKLTPESIIAFARSLDPKAPVAEAMAAFEARITDAATAADEYAKQFKAVADAERARLAPMIAAAGRRILAIQEALNGLDRRCDMSVADIEARRRRMIDASVPQIEVERLCPMPDRVAAAAERTVLLDEQATLTEFCRTGDESLLPAGFLAQVAQ